MGDVTCHLAAYRFIPSGENSKESDGKVSCFPE